MHGKTGGREVKKKTEQIKNVAIVSIGKNKKSIKTGNIITLYYFIKQ